MRTRSPAAAAALSVALSLAPASPAPAPDEAAWEVLRNDAGSLELQVPPGWREFPQADPAATLAVDYKEPPWKFTGVVALSYKWANPMPEFQQFVEKKIAGTPHYEPGSKTRFRVDKTIDTTEYVFLLDAYTAGGWAHYVRIGGPKSGYEERKAEWARILDSVKVFEPPPTGYAIPEGWRALRMTAMFHVMGPAVDPADAREKQRFETKMATVQAGLAATDERMKLLRKIAGDDRPWMIRRPVHVLPTAAAFNAACGDVAPEGLGAVHLPDHPERIVVVDGSSESASLHDEVAAAAGVSYLEGRIGRLPPWMRPALHAWLLNSFKSGVQPGLVPADFVARAVPAFAKSPPSFDQVLKMDDAAVKALDATARIVPWAYLQHALHGPDENLRTMVQEFLKASTGDAAAAWEKSTAGFKERGKKAFKPRDLDTPTREYMKNLAAAPPPPGSDWPVVRNDMETIEIKVPPGGTPREKSKAAIVIAVEWKEPPLKDAFIYCFSHDWVASIEDWIKFVVKDVRGTPIFEEGSTTRFRVEVKVEDVDYVHFVDALVDGKYGYYVLISSKKTIFDEFKDDWARVLDSMKARPRPVETYKVPTGWQEIKPLLMFQVMGPSSDVQDPKARKAFEGRLFQVNAWLDESEERMVMVREQIAGDKRKWMLRRPVHVFPTTEAFKAACGEYWSPGLGSAYLPEHAERIVVIDGSPDSALQQDEVAATAGLSYFEGRFGKLPAWMRPAFRQFFLNGFRRGCTPGLVPPEVLRAADAAFSKGPASFEAVVKMEEGEARALDDAARLVLWGYLQYGLNGGDSHVRNLFRGFLQGSIGAADAGPAWEKALETYRVQAKKPFKPKDMDAPTKKYVRELLKAEKK